MHERLKFQRYLFGIIATTAVLSACAGGGVSTNPGIGTAAIDRSSRPAAQARRSEVTVDDARRVAQHLTNYFGRLDVRPERLSFRTAAPQKLAVRIPVKTTLFAAADDDRIASVAPQATRTLGATTIYLTVTPHANGRAFIGLLDENLDYAIVPVTVEVPGMPTPPPSPSPSVPPSATPTPVVSATPTGLPTRPTSGPTPTPAPSTSPTATPTPVFTVTPVPTVPPSPIPTTSPRA